MWHVTKHDSLSHNVLVTWHFVFIYPRRWASTLNIMSVMSDVRCFIPISEKFLCLTKVFLVWYWKNPISRIVIMLVWMLLFESMFMLKRENGYGDEHDNWRGHEHGHGDIKKFACWLSVKSLISFHTYWIRCLQPYNRGSFIRLSLMQCQNCHNKFSRILLKIMRVKFFSLSVEISRDNMVHIPILFFQVAW
jgi:hypothetical protein